MCSNDKTMGVFIYLFFILSIFNMRTTFTFRLICLLLYYQYILETRDGETVTHFTHTQTYIYIYKSGEAPAYSKLQVQFL